MEASYYLRQKFSVTAHRNLISALQCHVPTVTENVLTVRLVFLAFYFQTRCGHCLPLWVHVTYLFIDSVIKSCDSPDWLVHTCYQSASSRVTEAKCLTQICFYVENLIIVSLNTVIPIIVIV